MGATYKMICGDECVYVNLPTPHPLFKKKDLPPFFVLVLAWGVG